MKNISNPLIMPFILISLLLISGCKPQQSIINGQTMGTYYSIKYIAPSNAPSESELQKQVDVLLEQVNDQMSTYRPNSELSRFNQSRMINQKFTVSAGTVKVVTEAFRINKLSNGALDITVGPLVNLWGFGPEEHKDRLPSEEELEKRKSWVGMDKLKVEENTLVKTIPELYLDLSSIAKGYGVDVVSEYLESIGINNYLVDIGGEVRTKGVNEREQRWRVAIEKPTAGIDQTVQEIIEPGDMSMATSGDYRNFFEIDGVRYSHTIDPRTGRPITNQIVSITVLSTSCMTADGLATALGVMGVEEGMALAEKLDIPVLMITKSEQSFVEHYSTAFKAKIVTH